MGGQWEFFYILLFSPDGDLINQRVVIRVKAAMRTLPPEFLVIKLAVL